jgi:hypothetical protein
MNTKTLVSVCATLVLVVGILYKRYYIPSETTEVDYGPSYLQRKDLYELLLHLRGLSGKQLLAAIHRVKKYDDHLPLDDVIAVLENGKDTIHSIVLPLSIPEAKEICRCYGFLSCIKRSPILRQLSDNITQVIQQHYPQGAFVKISSASAKDGQDESQSSFHRMYDAYLEKEDRSTMNETEMYNQRVCTISNIYQRMLKVNTGDEVLEMFLSSKKILAHLSAALVFPESFRKKLIIRKWEDLGVEQEFRGWAYQDQLVGVSQFSYFCYNESLIQYKDTITKAIYDFYHQTLVPKFKHLPNLPHKYMIDFTVRDWHLDKPEVMMLEVGGISDYAGLFTHDEIYRRGAQVMKGEKVKLELRVLQKMYNYETLAKHVPEWVPLLKQGLNETK